MPIRQNQAYSVAVQAGQQAQQGLFLIDVLSDHSPVGTFYCRVGVAIGTGATNVPINLPRKPSGCITFNSSAGTLVYQSAADVAATTGSVFVCRSNSSTTATILVG